jgi:hypothetical protein
MTTTTSSLSAQHRHWRRQNVWRIARSLCRPVRNRPLRLLVKGCEDGCAVLPGCVVL